MMIFTIVYIKYKYNLKKREMKQLKARIKVSQEGTQEKMDFDVILYRIESLEELHMDAKDFYHKHGGVDITFPHYEIEIVTFTCRSDKLQQLWNLTDYMHNIHYESGKSFMCYTQHIPTLYQAKVVAQMMCLGYMLNALNQQHFAARYPQALEVDTMEQFISTPPQDVSVSLVVENYLEEYRILLDESSLTPREKSAIEVKLRPFAHLVAVRESINSGDHEKAKQNLRLLAVALGSDFDAFVALGVDVGNKDFAEELHPYDRFIAE
jgi:hypothetical protein